MPARWRWWATQYLLRQWAARAAVSYEEALRTNRKEIFSLADDTVICPGHGPLTTVGEQKKHNPFYPEFQKSVL